MIKEFGYSQLGFEKELILSKLPTDGVIIDCRASPYGLINIQDLKSIPNYVWMKQLGNPYRKSNVPWSTLNAHFKEAVNKSVIAEISELQSRWKNVYLMCACKDYNQCHRKCIMEVLAGFNFEVSRKPSTLLGFR